MSDPSSITTWLSLLSQTLSTVPHTSKNATKARSEISLSILSRAICSHSSNNNNRELRLKYIKAGEEVWHESKLRAEWEDVLKLGGMEIWMEWLEWRIKLAVKGINGVVEDAERVLRSLGDSEDDEMGKLRVIWRVAIVLQNAGMSQLQQCRSRQTESFIQVSQNDRQHLSKHKQNCKPILERHFVHVSHSSSGYSKYLSHYTVCLWTPCSTR
jgi:hypothetical protein